MPIVLSNPARMVLRMVHRFGGMSLDDGEV